MIKHALENWKTTSAGLMMIVGAVVTLVFSIIHGTANENTWTISLGSIIGGVGLVFAGDSGKSVQIKDVQVDPGTGVLTQSADSTIKPPPIAADPQPKG